MKELSCDPYQGARRAFHILNPTANGEDWELWVQSTLRAAHGDFDNFHAFAGTCKTGWNPELDANDASIIAYSGGWFEAMDRLVHSLRQALPISGLIPHHIPRYRASLIDPDAQFE